jgi:hypothetical protein
LCLCFRIFLRRFLMTEPTRASLSPTPGHHSDAPAGADVR